jgi:hypothetical protein
MATDMEKLYYNPEFIDQIDDDVILFVLAHEVMHIALIHGMRLQMRNQCCGTSLATTRSTSILEDNRLRQAVWRPGAAVQRQVRGYVGRPDLREADEGAATSSARRAAPARAARAATTISRSRVVAPRPSIAKTCTVTAAAWSATLSRTSRQQ